MKEVLWQGIMFHTLTAGIFTAPLATMVYSMYLFWKSITISICRFASEDLSSFFKVCYAISKYPYFHRTYSLVVYVFLATSTFTKNSTIFSFEVRICLKRNHISSKCTSADTKMPLQMQQTQICRVWSCTFIFLLIR